jgi:hypothetical protein
MNAVFGKIPYALVYLDDILIFSNTAEEHAQHLKEVLSILREEKLYAKMSKCRFFQTELEYLGHLVGRDGVRVDPRKVDSVMQWPVPKDVHQIRAFLGLANYFRRFMQGYSTMVAPLTSLTKKDMVWDWSPECQRAFEMVKQALTNAPVLALPDPDADWEVVCDASLEGIGCVAMQNRRPVAYESRKFSPAERRYHTTDQELAAVVHALKTWRCYLEGAKGKVTVVTDHNPLTFFKTQPNLSRRQARWSEYLSRFHFEWEYRPGRINVADPFSRFPVHAEQEAVLGAFQLASLRMAAVGTAPAQPLDPFAGFLQCIRIGYFDDPWFLDERNVKKHGLEQQNGLYWHGDQVAVPKSLDLREQLMREYHDVPTSGHMGVQKTGQALSRHYWWPGWSAAVRDYCAMCDACQRNKPRNKRPAGLLQPLQMPDNCWKSVSMDFIVSLPLTLNKHDAIMVMVDRFSKMVHFVPTTTDVTAEGAARIFLERVISQHGLPLEIVSDRDPKFASRFWDCIWDALGTRLRLSSAFHPQTDGQTERANRTLEQMLRMYIDPRMVDWDDHLSMAEFAVNNSANESTKYTPFFLNSGRHPVVPASLVERGGGARQVPSAEAFVEALEEHRARALRSLHVAQQRQKAYADKERRELDFKVGDDVLLSTRNLTLKTPGARKFLPKFVGPFKVLAKVGSVAYRLELPPTMRIHNVFHVALLQPYSASGTYQPPPPMLAEDGQQEVNMVLAHRERRRRHLVTLEYLIRWAGCGPEHDTWEPVKSVPSDLVAKYWELQAARTERRTGGPPGVVAPRRSARLQGDDPAVGTSPVDGIATHRGDALS